MFTELLSRVLDFWGAGDEEGQLRRDARDRATRAYAVAWDERDRTTSDDRTPLIAAMRERNVPGAFGDESADEMLRFYVAHWERATDPDAVRKEARQVFR